MAETTFLSEAGVTVTQARFMVPGQTYAMSGVTSVKQIDESPSRKGPLVLGVIGVLALAGGAQGIIAAIIFIAAAAAWWYFQKSKHIVVLHSASGESRAFISGDAALVNRVVDALNNAIVHRG